MASPANKDPKFAAAHADNQAARRTRLGNLKGKLAARQGNPAYKENCEQIQIQIANLEKVIAAEGNSL